MTQIHIQSGFTGTFQFPLNLDLCIFFAPCKLQNYKQKPIIITEAEMFVYAESLNKQNPYLCRKPITKEFAS